MKRKLPVDAETVESFCRKWKITEFTVFGSTLRDDFGPQSDIDVMVSFAPDAEWSLWDHFSMKEELERLLKRSVDLLTRRSLEQSPNWIRRKAIFESGRTIYDKR
ncbi:MAG: nucleotidyltransferase [Planctomycetota bacterium]|nr:MAG: nucleotidyltransferase [Planctomycetota bacterium]